MGKEVFVKARDMSSTKGSFYTMVKIAGCDLLTVPSAAVFQSINPDELLEKVNEQKMEINQLRKALEESRAYADKLVDHIPYLPKDMYVLSNANIELSREVLEFKGVVDTLVKALRARFENITLIENVAKEAENLLKERK